MKCVSNHLEVQKNFKFWVSMSTTLALSTSEGTPSAEFEIFATGFKICPSGETRTRDILGLQESRFLFWGWVSLMTLSHSQPPLHFVRSHTQNS